MGNPHIHILPCHCHCHSKRNCTCHHWLAVIVHHDLVYPLHSTISPLSHSLKSQEVKEKKNSHPDPGGVFTPAFTLASFFTHAPVRALCVLTNGPFFASTHVDNQWVLKAGEVDFDKERLTERFAGLVFGWDGAPVCGWVGVVPLFVGYAGVGRSVCEWEKRKEHTHHLDSTLCTWVATLEFPS